MSTILRSSILVAAFGAALSAHAVNLDIALQSNGSFSVSGPSLLVSETVGSQKTYIAGSPVAMPALKNLDYSVSLINGHGTGTYTNGTDSLSFAFDIVPMPAIDPSAISISAAGNWHLTGTTGAFAPYQTGSGTLSATLSPATGLTSMTNFGGRLQAVPEPTSMAAVAVGAMGLLRRRKRA